MTETKCIYIADDDDNIRQVIRTFLLSDGFQVEDFRPVICSLSASGRRQRTL